jgi:hypothetical protein
LGVNPGDGEIFKLEDIFQGLEDAIDRTRSLMDLLAGLAAKSSVA